MDRAEFERRGFEGWIPLQTADSSILVPEAPGVYAVAYELGRPNIWPAVSCGGWYKGNDPSVTSDRLDTEWIDDCDIVYIGKTDQTLRKRIKAFARYGRGDAVAHQGGRLIWQLPKVQHLLIGWRKLEVGQPTAREADLFREFVASYGRLPFANLRY
jgi:hypothetical protein